LQAGPMADPEGLAWAVLVPSPSLEEQRFLSAPAALIRIRLRGRASMFS
jgi:hypothetical protein